MLYDDGDAVLVADDDEMVRLSVQKAFEGLCVVREVAAGDEVLDMYQTVRPDLIFLDIHMPEQNGLELVAPLREIDPAAYIVMLTGDSSENKVTTAIERGAAGYIVKPFEREKLHAYYKRCPTTRQM